MRHMSNAHFHQAEITQVGRWKHGPLELVCVAAVMGFVAVAASAFTPPPFPVPASVFNDGAQVHAVLRLSDGSVVVGGEFVSVNRVPRNNIAKLSPDGTLDTNWNPSANGAVIALAIDSSGNIYAGGDFTSIGGLGRNRIAKLSSDGVGAVDPIWNPSAGPGFVSPNGRAVRALAVDSNGNVYAGGAFNAIGGQSRNYIAKLSSSGVGAADATWNPSPNLLGFVETLVVDVSGNVYAGGNFSSIGGQARNHIAKLAGTGTGAANAAWNPSANNNVSALAIDGSGNVFAGGAFSTIGGQPRTSIAKLSASGTGAADGTWNPSVNDKVLAVVIDPAGSVYAGGSFTSAGGQPRNHIAKLSASGTGAADPTWNSPISSTVETLALDVSGRVYAGGDFVTAGACTCLAFAGLSSGTGAVVMGAEIEQPGVVIALARQPNGGMVVGGKFRRMDGALRANLLRLTPDGTLDADWDASANGQVRAVAAVNNDIYAGGDFSAIGGQNRNAIAKMSGGGTGAVDATWNPNANNVVNTIITDATGNVFVGGGFTSIGGQARNYIAKLSGGGTGAADLSWNPSANGSVLALAADGGGNLFAGGSFTTIGGKPRDYLAKLSVNGVGVVDPTWNPTVSLYGFIETLATDGTGNVYAGGWFTTIGGQNRNYIAKLSVAGTGAADATWDPSVSGVLPQPHVTTLATDSSGAVYVGGSFSAIGGQARQNIAKLSSIGAGAAEASWDPSASGVGFVVTVATDGRGRVYAGGAFTSVGSQPRFGLAAFSDADLIFANGYQ